MSSLWRANDPDTRNGATLETARLHTLQAMAMAVETEKVRVVGAATQRPSNSRKDQVVGGLLWSIVVQKSFTVKAQSLR